MGTFKQEVGDFKDDYGNFKQEVNTNNQETILNLRKKIGGLHKKLKGDMDEISGKLRADLGLLQSDQKVTQEKITNIERYMDRLRASNTYGEPIVNFNEDSVTKRDLNQVLAEEQKKVIKKIKEVKRQSTVAEPDMKDMREDLSLLKDMYKKH